MWTIRTLYKKKKRKNNLTKISIESASDPMIRPRWTIWQQYPALAKEKTRNRKKYILLEKQVLPIYFYIFYDPTIFRDLYVIYIYIIIDARDNEIRRRGRDRYRTLEVVVAEIWHRGSRSDPGRGTFDPCSRSTVSFRPFRNRSFASPKRKSESISAEQVSR